MTYLKILLVSILTMGLIGCSSSTTNQTENTSTPLSQLSAFSTQNDTKFSIHAYHTHYIESDTPYYTPPEKILKPLDTTTPLLITRWLSEEVSFQILENDPSGEQHPINHWDEIRNKKILIKVLDSEGKLVHDNTTKLYHFWEYDEKLWLGLQFTYMADRVEKRALSGLHTIQVIYEDSQISFPVNFQEYGKDYLLLSKEKLKTRKQQPAKQVTLNNSKKTVYEYTNHTIRLYKPKSIKFHVATKGSLSHYPGGPQTLLIDGKKVIDNGKNKKFADKLKWEVTNTKTGEQVSSGEGYTFTSTIHKPGTYQLKVYNQGHPLTNAEATIIYKAKK